MHSMSIRVHNSVISGAEGVESSEIKSNLDFPSLGMKFFHPWVGKVFHSMERKCFYPWEGKLFHSLDRKFFHPFDSFFSFLGRKVFSSLVGKMREIKDFSVTGIEKLWGILFLGWNGNRISVQKNKEKMKYFQLSVKIFFVLKPQKYCKLYKVIN